MNRRTAVPAVAALLGCLRRIIEHDWLAGGFPVDTKDAPKQATLEPGALKG